MKYVDNPEFDCCETSANNNDDAKGNRPPAKHQVSFKLTKNGLTEDNTNDSFRSDYDYNVNEEDNVFQMDENEQPHAPRRTTVHSRRDSFRAIERKGSRGQAGGRCSRLGAYFRERTSCLFAHKNSEPREDQYCIPPPEEENESIFDAFGQLYSFAFDDLSMWLYAASFWKILLFYWILYMMFVVVFVVVLCFVDRINLNDPTKSGGGCINTLREEGVLPLHAQLEFAFELSWTTFTTVGYGVSASRSA